MRRLLPEVPLLTWPPALPWDNAKPEASLALVLPGLGQRPTVWRIGGRADRTRTGRSARGQASHRRCCRSCRIGDPAPERDLAGAVTLRGDSVAAAERCARSGACCGRR